ncbi:MAG: hypothetical protein HPM95_13500 [Alphaproteobacteria bacterium]|nr:hypothetical protein [Alphaproteobacteria bacterium]
MYDWPEVREATDAVWASLRDAFRAAGSAAPEDLTPDRPPLVLWQNPQLCRGQACGFPFVRHLGGGVRLLGAPACAIPGCPPGTCRTVFVVRAKDRALDLEALRGRRCGLQYSRFAVGRLGSPRAAGTACARRAVFGRYWKPGRIAPRSRRLPRAVRMSRP